MTQQMTPVQEFGQSLRRMEGQFKAALPTTISPEKFFNVAQTAIAQRPDLLECDRQSLILAFVRCAQAGLMPDGKEAIIQSRTIKGVKKASYEPMAYGLLKKLHKTGEVKSTSCDVVYENDEFDLWTDENGTHLKHRPNLKGQSSNPVCAYFILRTEDDGVFVEYMTTAEIEKARSKSQNGNGGPWVDQWNEMAKKTVIKRADKRMPLPEKFRETLKADEEDFQAENQPQVVLPEQPKELKQSRVKKIIAASAQKTELPIEDQERQAIQVESAPI